MVSDRPRILLGVVSWSGLVSAITLQRLYQAPNFTTLEWAMIFLASVLAGIVLEALENIVLGFAATMVLSSLMIGGALALPSTLGFAGPIGSPLAQTEAAKSVVRALFPLGTMIVLTGGLVGGFVAGRLGLS